MESARLLQIAQEGGYWSYAAGVAFQAVTHYSVGGIEIDNYASDLPLKKGLSSSAATCVLVARALNRVYDLHLTTRGEMDLAYRGEITTPSRCGRMDQGCAYGETPVVMDFDGDAIEIEKLQVGADLYFVLVDLKAHKDTVRILAALNRAFPFAGTKAQRLAQSYLGATNREIVCEAIKAIAGGDGRRIGVLMNEAQAQFDRNLTPLCPEELTAPVLHELLANTELAPLIWGGKGVGSQGDGSAQFVARGKEAQSALVGKLSEMGYSALPLTMRKTRKVRIAVITAAGFGTRLFPMTKIVRKEFLPIVDRGLLKPLILKQVEDALEAGMEEIYLIIQQDEEEMFKKLFSEPLKPEHYQKLGPEARKLADTLAAHSRKVKYIHQREQGGLGHAVLQAQEIANGEPFVLILGDHVFRNSVSQSCLQQLLEASENEEGNIIGVMDTAESDLRRYGCVGGKWIKQGDRLLSIDCIVEKPDIEYAREHLVVEGMKEGEYLSVAGIYIITPSILADLRDAEASCGVATSELGLTATLERIRRTEGFVGYRIQGTKNDIGVVSYWSRG
jgi:UTP-glucose-1-phosphate uridylyltransferase/mevalonate kinase